MKPGVFGFALGVIVAVTCSGCGRESAPVESPTSKSDGATAPPVAAAPVAAGYEKLKGKWERQDGDYILEMRGVDPAGKLDAAYFNPNPIKVSQAQASREGGGLKVFVELRDVNYPGCTYKLTYDAKNDQLLGQYFQAALQETYDVAFIRKK